MARAIDLVEEERDELLPVSQQRTGLDARLAVRIDVGVINEVGRHQVDRAFDALEAAADGTREGAQDRGLADADVAFEQHARGRTAPR